MPCTNTTGTRPRHKVEWGRWGTRSWAGIADGPASTHFAGSRHKPSTVVSSQRHFLTTSTSWHRTRNRVPMKRGTCPTRGPPAAATQEHGSWDHAENCAVPCLGNANQGRAHPRWRLRTQPITTKWSASETGQGFQGGSRPIEFNFELSTGQCRVPPAGTATELVARRRSMPNQPGITGPAWRNRSSRRIGHRNFFFFQEIEISIAGRGRS